MAAKLIGMKKKCSLLGYDAKQTGKVNEVSKENTAAVFMVKQSQGRSA
jgi:hypothetical protein